MDKATTIAIIGAGHMGMSLLGGLIAHGYPAQRIFLTDPSSEKLQHAKQQFHVNTTMNNVEAVQASQVIIFAVKPDMMIPVAKELSLTIQQHKPLVISVAAGVCEVSIQQYLGGNIPIIRTMPNTPALIGCGATALYANPYTSEQQRQLAESILQSVGMIVWINDEKLMDIVTALSGSGPAYFYLIIEALQNAGEKSGLPVETARQLALQTAYGAARLALESNEPVSELCQHAMTPGGTTEQGVRVLKDNKIYHIFEEVIQAAAARAKELGEIYK